MASVDFTTASGMLQAAIDRIGDSAVLKVYGGSVPANLSVAITSEPLLAETTLSSTSFNPITDADPGAQATAGPITMDSSGNATGTATFFRIEQSGGTEILQGTAGEGAEELVFDNADIVVGNEVSVSTLTLTHPES